MLSLLVYYGLAQLGTGLDHAGQLPAPLTSGITAGRGLTVPLLVYCVFPFFNGSWPARFVKFPLSYVLWVGMPWLGFGVFRYGRLIHLMNQGYGITDIRIALHDWRRRRTVALAVEHRKVPA